MVTATLNKADLRRRAWEVAARVVDPEIPVLTIADLGVLREVTLTEAARMLDLSPMTVLRQLRAGIIPAEQYCKGAPWVIKRRDIEDQQRVERTKMGRKGPSSSAGAQQRSLFQ